MGGLLEEAGVDGADGVEAVEMIAAELAEAVVVRRASDVSDSVGNLVGRPWTHFGFTRKWHGTCPPLRDVVRDSGRHPTCWSRRGRSSLYKRSVRSEGSFSQKCGGTGQAAAMSAETPAPPKPSETQVGRSSTRLGTEACPRGLGLWDRRLLEADAGWGQLVGAGGPAQFSFGIVAPGVDPAAAAEGEAVGGTR